MRTVSILSAIALAIPSCVPIDYQAAPVGRFSGSLFVMWVGEGGDDLGAGKFVFVPNPKDPLVFTRGGSHQIMEIRPAMMYTDGGSIPKIADVFHGFGPWGYAPAYMIHDWLFVARHCNLDGRASTNEAKMSSMTFRESADVIAEAIKTLQATGRVSKDDVAPSVISSTVAGPLAESLWNDHGKCQESRVSEVDRQAAEAGIPGSSADRTVAQRVLPDGRTVPVKPGAIVGAFSF